jgi:hypothetical protein
MVLVFECRLEILVATDSAFGLFWPELRANSLMLQSLYEMAKKRR